MRTKIAFTTLAVSCLGLVMSSGIAHAATSGATPVTLTIAGGSLGISVPSANANLGTFTNVVGGGVLTGNLGVVVVSDARSAAAGSGWIASAISTAFTPASGPTIGAASVSYDAGTITKVGTATFTKNVASSLAGVSPVVTATGITGDNSATWNPEISVLIPGGIAAGTYSATITHSVL